jgi:acid phosphatase type 7
VRAARRSAASCQAKATSDLLVGRRLAAVLVLGDAVNSYGADREYRRAYGPTWGRVKAITHPVPGNHDYRGAGGGAAYFRYFGAAAGRRSRGYYSFDLGAWHLIALNSNCGQVGGCQAGSRQERWLRADLARHPSGCTLAYWHRPRFSSRRRGTDTWPAAFWRDLYRSRVDVVLNGHDHDYERFAPLDPAGRPDPARGVRPFVVGTGGKSHLPLTTVRVGSQVRNTDTFGVLELTLRPGGYRWRFRPVAGGAFTDTGAADCH